MNLSKLLKKIFFLAAGKIRFQNIFIKLHQISLAGMNIGGGSNPKESGEKIALEYINARFKTLNELTIFDVGANCGKYSLLVKEVFGDRTAIYSFEPSCHAFKILSSNIGEQKKIILHNFGFGSEDRKMVLFSNAEGSGMASVYKRRLDHFNINMDLREEIELKTIDGFCKRNNIKHIHFLKLDAEGHELKILDGASNMLSAGEVDFIQFEFGGCNIDSRTYFQDFYYLLKDNYKIYRILRNGFYPIDQYKEMYEAFTTTNYLAERFHLESSGL